MTFTKLFSSITESTVWCEDDQTRIVWITMLAMANKNGFVFGSEPGLANRARVPLDKVLAALEKFALPDEYSRSKEFEGRRIEKVDGGWRLLNYLKHRSIRDEEERREYMKIYMRQRRSVSKSVSNVSHSKPPLAQAEAEADSRVQTAEARVKSVVHFVHPSLEEISAYCQSRKNEVDPHKWLDYYTANGWHVGRNKMKDWKAAIRTWEKNNFGGPFRDGYQKSAAQRRTDAIDRAIAAAEAAEGVPSAIRS